MKTSTNKYLNLRDERKERRDKKIYRGEVVAVNPVGALVRVGGSQNAQQAELQSTDPISVGDIVRLEKNITSQRNHWTITGFISKRDVGYGSDTEQSYRELFPPENLRSEDTLAGGYHVIWDAPITFPVTFEVVYSTDGTEATQTGDLFTRGSYCIMLSSESTLYFRVRSVAPNGQKSAWTDWLEVAATSGSSSFEEWEITLSADKTLTANHQKVIDEITVPSGITLTVESTAILKVI